MTPINTSQSFICAPVNFNVPNEYLSAFLSDVQEKTNPVKLAEINTVVQQHAPRIMTFFPMGVVPCIIGASTLDAFKNRFESLADKTAALSKTGFSAKQIVHILAGSGSEIAARADEVVKFTQPKIDRNNEALHLPSDLEYLLNSGLSHEHISNMLFRSGVHLSTNIKTLRSFVTPSIYVAGADRQTVWHSPFQWLEKETGFSKDQISRILSQYTSCLAEGFNHILSMAYAIQNTPFNEVFNESVNHIPEEFGASEMIIEDANDILEILGTDSRNYSEASFSSVGGEATTAEDAHDVLNVLGVNNKVEQGKVDHCKEPFLLGDADDLLLNDRDYISDMFSDELYPLGG